MLTSIEAITGDAAVCNVIMDDDVVSHRELQIMEVTEEKNPPPTS
jgi:hypothetical protein